MTQQNTAATIEAPAPQRQDGVYLQYPQYPLVLKFSALEMSDEQLVQFCGDNDELRIELTAEKELVIMPPAFPTTGRQNATITGELYIWSKRDGTGVAFDSSAGFTLPNGAMRSPDASWIARERWDTLVGQLLWFDGYSYRSP